MSVLKTVQRNVHENTGGLFANWMPPDHIAVGDYGQMTCNRFVREGNLRNHGVEFEVETLPSQRSDLAIAARATIKTEGHAGAALDLQAANAELGAKIEFDGAGAFLFHLDGLTTRRLKDQPAFLLGLSMLILSRQLEWTLRSAIVTEVRLAKRSTISVSEGKSEFLSLRGRFPTGLGNLAKVEGSARVEAISGSLLNWVSAGQLTPLIYLMRPAPRGTVPGWATGMASRLVTGWSIKHAPVGNSGVIGVQLDSSTFDPLEAMNFSAPSVDEFVGQDDEYSRYEMSHENIGLRFSAQERRAILKKYLSPHAKYYNEL